MKTVRSLLLGLAFLLTAPMLSTAAPAASGTVQGPAPGEAIAVTFPVGSEIQPRDVFIILHDGKPLGECLVVSVKGTSAVLLPKANFNGKAARGDQAIFARHALAVGALRESDRGAMPAWSHGQGKGSDGWYTVSVPEGPFEVRMPGKPIAVVKPTFCMWLDEERDARYAILYVDTKPGANTKDPEVQAGLFGSLATLFHKDHGGTISRPKILAVQGYPGCEYELTDAKPPFTNIQARMILSGQRLYQMWVETRPGTSADTKRFFGSMLLLDSMAAQAGGQKLRGWQTYTDPQSAFSLSYPPDVSFTRDPTEIAQLTHSKDSTAIRCYLILGPNQHMSVIVGGTSGASTQDVANSLLALAVKGGATAAQNPTAAALDGKDFLSMEYTTSSEQIRSFVYVRADTHEAYIVNCEADKEHFSQAVAVFDQILKSMRFSF